MSLKKFPEKLPQWNKDGLVKCQVCQKNNANIRNLVLCLWCYFQYREKDFDNPKWKEYFSRKDE
jgi:hypothetical protein